LENQFTPWDYIIPPLAFFFYRMWRMWLMKVRLLCEAEYFISRVGYVTEEKSCVNVFEFRSGIGIPEVY
jgi:hypothetical protein